MPSRPSCFRNRRPECSGQATAQSSETIVNRVSRCRKAGSKRVWITSQPRRSNRAPSARAPVSSVRSPDWPISSTPSRSRQTSPPSIVPSEIRPRCGTPNAAAAFATIAGSAWRWAGGWPQLDQAPRAHQHRVPGEAEVGEAGCGRHEMAAHAFPLQCRRECAMLARGEDGRSDQALGKAVARHRVAGDHLEIGRRARAGRR